MINLFIKGLILGFLIAAPVGPIGILCIRKSLQFGRLSGFISGLGAAVADSFYGAVAAFGLTLIANFLLAGQFWLQLVGGLFLFYIGVKTLFSLPQEKIKELPHKTLTNDFLTTFFLTITNPMTILAYLAIFAGLALPETKENFAGASFLVLGVFTGSSLWWLTLSVGVGSFRKKISQKMMKWINRLAGIIIIGFSLWILFKMPFH